MDWELRFEVKIFNLRNSLIKKQPYTGMLAEYFTHAPFIQSGLCFYLSSNHCLDSSVNITLAKMHLIFSFVRSIISLLVYLFLCFVLAPVFFKFLKFGYLVLDGTYRYYDSLLDHFSCP